MQPIKSILVAVDRSSTAADAVGKAVLLARAAGARVELFMCDAEHAYSLAKSFDSTGVEKARAASVADARRHLEILKRSAQADDVSITIDAACDSPLYEGIVRKVLHDQPDLVIKNVSEPLNRFDVTDWQLMRACPATLLLTRGRPWQSPPWFAAAVDASGAESAGLLWDILQAAHNLTTLTGGRLNVLYAESTELSDAEREAGTRSLHEHVRKLPAIPAAVHVLAGTPEASLPTFAKRHTFDALLLGALTHRPGFAAQVGTLTSRLAEMLDCDFLVIKPRNYHCQVGESYNRPDTSASISG